MRIINFPFKIKVNLKKYYVLCFRDSLVSFELEHIHNTVLLLLYLDILFLELNYTPKPTEELFFDLINKKEDIFKQLTGGVRTIIKMNRISFYERIYTGFDSEFISLEYGKTKLLAFTTATFSRFVIVIKLLKIDFSSQQTISPIINMDERKPVVFDLIYFIVYAIRYLKNMMDNKVEDLLNYLNNELKKELDVCITENSCIFFHKKALQK
jgi:hypothetical protein